MSRTRQFLIASGAGRCAVIRLSAVNLRVDLRAEPRARVLCSVDKSAMGAVEADRIRGMPFEVGCGNERRPANCFQYDSHILDITNVPQPAKGALLLRACVGTPQ